MVVNFDQTGTKMVPVSDWNQGTKQIEVVGRDDKREITLLLAISLSGELLNPQVIYAGKTDRCHADAPVPPGWNVTHSASHWSTTETMVEHVDAVLAPYMKEQRQKLGLEPDATGLCLFDVFAAHRHDDFLKKLSACSIKAIFVPAGCTGFLQPLNVLVNHLFKQQLTQNFSEWYAEQVKKCLEEGVEISDIRVDLKTSILKPIHFQWLIKSIAWLAQQEEALISGWKDSGILNIIGQ